LTRGEARTDAAGAFRFRTILPAAYASRPRHIHARITPPGRPSLTTQLYFKGDRDLMGDGIVRRLGAALELVTLAPETGADGTYGASITLVVAR
jgi:protocatechuate 3,4-dioxygenase beta subunit